MYSPRWFTASLALCLFCLTCIAQDPTAPPKTGFLDRVYKSESGESKYVLFVPHSYDGSKEYPLILFLHGAGESGTDGKKQVTVGLGPAIKKQEKDFPFITIFPQANSKTTVGKRWYANSPDGKQALAILDEVMRTYKVDPKRIYLTGLSMGGFGTWDIAATYPDKFAAIAPICGGGDPSKAKALAKLPIWNFHGDADKVVPVELSRRMIAAIKEAGGEPKYDEYPGVGHNSWDKAYANPELYKWLLSHSRK
jgi:predicted peptidase